MNVDSLKTEQEEHQEEVGRLIRPGNGDRTETRHRVEQNGSPIKISYLEADR
jgi:hypothetical protein